MAEPTTPIVGMPPLDEWPTELRTMYEEHDLEPGQDMFHNMDALEFARLAFEYGRQVGADPNVRWVRTEQELAELRKLLPGREWPALPFPVTLTVA